jgi:hypothetical protein
VTGTSEEHPEIQRLLQLGVAEELIERFAALCLPENLLAASRREDLLDSQDSVDLAKRLKAAGVLCGTSYDLTPEAATVQRRGGDLWLGTVWILDPQATGLIAEVIIRKLSGWLERTMSRKARVHLRLRLRANREVAEIGYSGGGRTLIRIMDGLRKTGGKTSGKTSEKERERSSLRRIEVGGQ